MSRNLRVSAVLPAGNRGKGRKKGVPNKATREAREAIALLLDNNVDKVQGWLDRVAKRDPKGALMAFIALLEFGVPKLARQELKVDAGTPGSLFAPEHADAILAAVQGRQGLPGAPGASMALVARQEAPDGASARLLVLHSTTPAGRAPEPEKT